ncbi:MAG: non-canonical purine NTP pyrophosphatase, partial [Burkholderiales bacterium]|nr:non-canonical purine NTP pyrophosphatase [Burkholderiales bacterium]
PLIAAGLWRGDFTDPPRVQGGFGYDPHFWLPALGCPVAQLASERKNAPGHRGQAMRAQLEKLRAVTAP